MFPLAVRIVSPSHDRCYLSERYRARRGSVKIKNTKYFTSIGRGGLLWYESPGEDRFFSGCSVSRPGGCLDIRSM